MGKMDEALDSFRGSRLKALLYRLSGLIVKMLQPEPCA